MPMIIALALAAALPEVPASDVQFLQEGKVWVLRNLVDNNLLYTLDIDAPGQSSCDAACAADWRPLRASADEKPVGAWTMVTRDDGSMQWAFRGHPIYSFARDPEPVTIAGKVGHWRAFPTFPVE